jgi:transposase
MANGKQQQDARDRILGKVQRELKAKEQTVNQLVGQLEKANRRIAELEKELGKSPTTKLDEPFSVEAEEERQGKRGKRRKPPKKPNRRKGRVTNADKLAKAVRTEAVYPEGVPEEDCWLSHTRPIWRFENGSAVIVAYEVYRGPKNQFGKVSGALGRSEFGIEIFITLAYLIFIAGLSFDKACSLLKFFQGLNLSKSQADALLKQLSAHWESEFDVLCTLLANSMVVHADETSWSIKSVWTFLSENARVTLFGVNKDAKTLAQLIDPETFGGTVISDNAAVYANFTKCQKCWAHLLRKAIKLTLMEPDNEEYRQFTDGLLEIYRKACRLQADKRFGDGGRERRISELEDELTTLCEGMWFADLPPQEEEALDGYRKLVNELMRLVLNRQLFTFVTGGIIEQPNGESSPMAGTNNESERDLRDPSKDRNTGRGSKTSKGGRRRTVLQSVLGSLRLYLSDFTLGTIIEEVQDWATAGKSCFSNLLERMKLPPPEASILDALFPDTKPSTAG